MNDIACSNCDEFLKDCQCDDRYIFTNSDHAEGPICPHCGELFNVLGNEAYELYEEKDYEKYDCVECDKTFSVNTVTTQWWTSRREY